MPVLLTETEQADALLQLHRAGIVGSDASTCLRTAALVGVAGGYRDWRRSLTGRTSASLSAEYGADAVRAAIVLSQA